jgi:hypothetical protein
MLAAPDPSQPCPGNLYFRLGITDGCGVLSDDLGLLFSHQLESGHLLPQKLVIPDFGRLRCPWRPWLDRVWRRDERRLAEWIGVGFHPPTLAEIYFGVVHSFISCC